MGDDASVLLSVRADAHQTATPDTAVLTVSITATRSSKADALQTTASILDDLTTELAETGGVALTVDTERAALTWSAFSTSTHVEREYDATMGCHEPIGRIIASVAVNLAVRNFGQLDTLGAVLARQNELHVQHVAWRVDDDNPAWPAVRAAAIEAAVRQGRDYAAALGGSLRRVEHVADVGLLGENTGSRHIPTRVAAAGFASTGDDGDAPSLDPVPQQIGAVIEARFVVDGVSISQI
ncbi:MAG: SIMPL domain-containing protein [Acidimicrobiales bacterium]